MELKYQVKGMSCAHCQSRVQKALNSIVGVDAIVSLTPLEALIKSEKEITLSELQKALSNVGDYTIERG